MAAKDSKSVPDFVFVGCIAVVVLVIGFFFYKASINQPTGPRAMPAGFLQHLKQRPGASPTGAVATNQ